jgi:hypothetical protein
MKTQTPVEKPNEWELRLSVPGWLATVEGDSGINGQSSHMRLGFGEIVPKVDMAAALRFELRKGKFGIYGDFLYMSLSDGIGRDRLLKKISFRQDEYMADLGLSWKITESDRGYVEIIAGARYTNLFTEVTLQTNDQNVENVSERLAQAGTVARVVLREELRDISGNNPKLPGPQIAARQEGRLAGDINALRSQPDRQERIERRLKRDLNRRLAATEYWFDPYVGIRGRYNFSEKVYFLGRADIGGFSIGADLSWQASAGFGYQLSERKFFEVTYRALGVDYENDGYIYDMITHGAEVSLGMTF